MSAFICSSLQEIETEETNELDSFSSAATESAELDARRLLLNAENKI